MKKQEITISRANKGWHHIVTPTEDRFVSDVFIAGIQFQLEQSGTVTLTVENDKWEIDEGSGYLPTLLIEAPGWYSRPKNNTE